MPQNSIIIKGARVHNLKNINLEIPKNALVVITGLSGSGKSSLAFDTIFAEAQRQYLESMSSYARQFLGLMDKPDVDEIKGLSPVISIDQKTIPNNPRSTVGTMTEIYDYLRLLYAKAGTVHDPKTGLSLKKTDIKDILNKIMDLPAQTRITILSPLIIAKKGNLKSVLERLQKASQHQVRLDGKLYTLAELANVHIDEEAPHDLDLVIDHFFTERIRPERLLNSDLFKSVKTALDLSNGLMKVLRKDTGEEIEFSENLYNPTTGEFVPELELRSFSFNSPYGACTRCTGLGVVLEIDPQAVIFNPKLSIAEGAIKVWSRMVTAQSLTNKVMEAAAKEYSIDLKKPVKDLKSEKVEILLRGTGDKEYVIDGKPVKFEGIIDYLEKKYLESDSEYIKTEIGEFMTEKICPACNGQRLRPESLAVTFDGKTISDLVTMDLEKLHAYCTDLEKRVNAKNNSELTELEKKVAIHIVKEVRKRLGYLIDVSLGYLTLNRSAVTLSGGEAQRIRLAKQISSSLTGIVYILDEPSIGLHQRDNEKLIKTLLKLRDLGNSVLVVEHDKAIMQAADLIIDIGPGAGALGGEIVGIGSYAELTKLKNSLTADYLLGRKIIAAPKKVRVGNGKDLEIVGAEANNLKNVTVKIPLGRMVAITGVSGSGKSTLITDILSKSLAKHFYRAKEQPAKHKEILGVDNLDKVVTVDQSPIGKTPRSNPATYTGLFTYIRDIFTQVPEAKLRGYDAGNFSFNVVGGRCETCSGDGYVKIEMQFLPDVFVECEECQGQRYNREILDIHYKEKHISNVLNMSVAEALVFFDDHNVIKEKLNILNDVGLGYIRLGQPANTLSGGEAQRVKLATELSRRSTGKTLYILDEPTTGLHFDDIKKLLGVLNRLVDKGNTVLIIEHNTDVINACDWVIDLGPDGGEKGGELVAVGTPADIKKVKNSWTGKYL